MSHVAPIRDAVTVVLQHGEDLYMIRRQPALPMFPGYWAFPGGKVDPEDLAEGQRDHAHFAGISPGFTAALVRELKEEVGFDLDTAAASGAILDLQFFGIALMPPIAPVRFNTHFFRVRLRERPALTLDLGEVECGEWASVGTWLSQYREGRLLLAPPTRYALELFEADDTLAAGLAALDALHAERMPILEPVHGVRVMNVRSNTLPPAAHTNCFLLGDEPGHRLLVDPSPMNRDERDALIARVKDLGVGEVFLTHHHPDHRQFANEIAHALKVPIGASADTQQRILAREPQYFEGLGVRTHAEGEEVTRWLGRPVRIYAVPGHDEGQLALMPDDRAWCIVGDLIQGIGTVVIAKPEGHMGRYFASLQRLIDLDPAVIFPSHGMGMGTTFRLSETLKHRRMREATVHQMHRDGHSIDEMLKAIYVGVDPRLMPLARMNIEAHLDKLREDGVLA
jgi:glyoxylase-like metal-dependent hydrolase (beta-lactamase superfamily II)/8-oxo-dGTP pyrophosphatase MutT (NUDIX family)